MKATPINRWCPVERAIWFASWKQILTFHYNCRSSGWELRCWRVTRARIIELHSENKSSFSTTSVSSTTILHQQSSVYLIPAGSALIDSLLGQSSISNVKFESRALVDFCCQISNSILFALTIKLLLSSDTATDLAEMRSLSVQFEKLTY